MQANRTSIVFLQRELCFVLALLCFVCLIMRIVQLLVKGLMLNMPPPGPVRGQLCELWYHCCI